MASHATQTTPSGGGPEKNWVGGSKPNTGRHTWRTYVTWSGVALLALSLRVWNIGGPAFWCDEFYSIAGAKGVVIWAPPIGTSRFLGSELFDSRGWAGVGAAVIEMDGGNAFLYSALLRGWLNGHPATEAWTRLLSALIGTLTVLLIGRVAFVLFGSRTALVAGLMATFHPLLIAYSREARGYSLATLFVCLLLTLLVNGATSLGRGLLSSLIASAAFLSHLLTLPTVFATLLFPFFVLTGARGRLRETLGHLLLAAVFVATTAAAWFETIGESGLTTMQRVQERHAERALKPREAWARPSNPKNLLDAFLVGAQSALGSSLSRVDTPRRWTSLELCVALIPFVLFAGTALGEGSIFWLFMIGTMPLMQGLLLSISVGHVLPLMERYLVWGIPHLIVALSALLVRGFQLASARRRKVASIALVSHATVVLLSLELTYLDAPRFRARGAFALASAEISATCDDGDTIVFPRWAAAHMTNFYGLPSRCWQEVRPSHEPISGQKISLVRGARVVGSWDAPPDEYN